MKKAYLRFYEELNDLLPKEKRKVRFEHAFRGNPSIKDMIESLGIPHTEVDMIIANGKSVSFNYSVKENDDISIYPVFESIDILNIQHLRAQPLRNPKFVNDVHLGTLARYLRLTGFDTLYENDYNDEEIVKISNTEKRTILTKDKGILKRNEVTHGYFVRNIDPEKQLIEIIKRFDLKDRAKEFTRCLECNTELVKIEKERILDKLPSKVKQWHNEFWYCPACDKIYWKGTHYNRMIKIIQNINSIIK